MKPQISKKNNVIFLILFFIKKKRIISLEKNPEKKKNPIILKRLNKMEKERNSDLIITFPNKRLSWLWLLMMMQYPILIKSKALKIAWIIRCRKPIKGLIKQHLVIIKPRCLKVERAITFFKSFSKRANIPANNKVIIPLIISIFITKLLFAINKKNRITRYTPAVTRVEEWTRDEIGVGAAIAAGSQFINGNCALLVKLPNRNKIIEKIGIIDISFIEKFSLNNKIAKVTTNKPSPRRLVIAVFIAAAHDEEFWKKITKKNEVAPNPSQPISSVKILPLKIKKIIDIINKKVARTNRYSKISSFIYSIEKKKTDKEIMVRIILKNTEKKSIRNLISIIWVLDGMLKKTLIKISSFFKKKTKEANTRKKIQKNEDKYNNFTKYVLISIPS